MSYTKHTTITVRKGNVFTSVCHSVHEGCIPVGTGADIPLPSTRWDTHLPAECMLRYTPPDPLPSACWDTHHQPPAQCMLGYIPSFPVHSEITSPTQCMLGSTPPSRHPLDRYPPGLTLSGHTPPVQCMLGYTPREQTPLGRYHPPDGHCSGRHACYWNEFLMNTANI